MSVNELKLKATKSKREEMLPKNKELKILSQIKRFTRFLSVSKSN